MSMLDKAALLGYQWKNIIVSYLIKLNDKLKKEPNKKCRDKYMYFAIETFSDKDDEDIWRSIVS